MYRVVVEQRTNAIALLFQHSINKRKIHLIASTVSRAGSSLARLIFTAITIAMRARKNRQ